MEIIKEFRMVTEQIAVVKSKIKSAERDLEKCMEAYCPSDVKGIEYKEKVQVSSYQINILEMAEKIIEIQSGIHILKEELLSLYAQSDEVSKVINELGDIKKQILMLRIKNWSLRKISLELNYSISYIEKISADLKKVK